MSFMKNMYNFVISKSNIAKHKKYFKYLDVDLGTTKYSVGPNIYKQNPIVYKCVNLIAQSCSHIPLHTYINGQRSTSNPVYRSLISPNPFCSGFEFFNTLISHKLLYGNAYMLSINNGANIELHLLHPSKVNVLISNNHKTGYRYSSDSGERVYEVNDQFSKIMHIRNYNPHDQIYGLSCLEAAKMAIELYTRSSEWNNTLLKNGARPSGALVFKDGNGYLSDEQFTRLQDQLMEKYSGSENSGKPIILEGGLEWRELSLKPSDMGFGSLKAEASREIALAFGVPPQLLGIQGDNTYSNMEEARKSLWDETLIPLMDELCDALTHHFNDTHISFDKKDISILASKNYNLLKQLDEIQFMTINEKRISAGLPCIDGLDVINPLHLKRE